MNDPLNDPMVVSVGQKHGKLPSGNKRPMESFIESIFSEMNQSLDTVDAGSDISDEQKTRQVNLDIPPYTPDYKPDVSNSRKHIYSINELLDISKAISPATSEEIISTLPKKKFWRLNRRFSDNQSHGKNVGHKNSKNSGSNRAGSSDDLAFERRNSKNKGARATHPKKGNRYGKTDGLMEEKDIAVNNDDLLALEEEFEPTGNSMADFEMWKAKMRELERKKKGLPVSEVNEPQEPVMGVSTTSSSISDFLKLNTKNKDSEAAHCNSIPDSKTFTEKSSKQSSDSTTEPTMGTSSRFSSFFTNSTSGNSSPALKTTEPEIARSVTLKNTDAASSAPNGSRLLSFFNKEQMATKEVSTFSNSPKQQPNFMPPPGFAPQGNSRENPKMAAHPTMPPLHQIPQHPQTNNAFFQGLLNKGKVNGSPIAPGPPPGVPLPNNAPHISQQPHQPQFSRQPGQSGSLGAPPGFNVQMHPPGFPSPMQGGPAQMPNMIPVANTRNKESSSNGVSQKNGPPQQSQQRQAPLQPGMIPQQFVPPPGFPPMQSIPPNFNPNMYMPSNGMLPPNGQQFFPPVPPPNGAMNFPPFPNQAGFPPQKTGNK